ncbi:MAG: pyruvate ferredoxin oxidoreductase [candidate division WOR-3 bacterium]|mgnify:CR=1 FL=1|uniref:Pyruvate ferredoxin oxidoreductase n=2 Tax=candidate division WOR-3 bacterium TaxID=2052148 RepID=A0A7C3EYB7_UNCW3|nr:pyruvate ferredoxin oxidoreductase [candidate division WOR-3 bacterium]
MILAKTGNEALAYAMKQINPDVVAAYPITPSTEIVQLFSNYVADGEVDTEFVPVESEHSAMTACIGAAACGRRVMTATASQGLALMHEMLFIAAGLRLPIVMAVASRSLSSPLNIHGDHSDSVASRDSGWLQFFCETVQEGYDTLIMAVKIAERAYLPAIVAIDGFILSHCQERIETLEDRAVREFLGQPKPNYNLLDWRNPILVGPATLQDYYFEFKRSEIEGMRRALPVIEEVQQEFGQRFGRYYPVLEEYRCEDAEAVLVVMGSACGTCRVAVDQLRAEGRKVGLVKLRVFRPLVHNLLRTSLAKFPKIGVMDRVDAVNSYGGPLFTEITSVLYDLPERPKVFSYVYGLGGREFSPEDARMVYEQVLSGKKDELVTYVGVR